jgi:hypothetical protein
VHVCRLSYYRLLPDNVYEHRFWSCLFFVDSRSGALLERWTNPLKQSGLDPFVMPWTINGDDVWCTLDSNFGLQNYDTSGRSQRSPADHV